MDAALFAVIALAVIAIFGVGFLSGYGYYRDRFGRGRRAKS